ncbi:Cytochrome b-245 light chain [Lamellibrachia satsuma]|nr:Cytochrome b-245 light chain [Lamellibrachia satsuma]
MGQIEWAMWANEQAIVGVVVLFLGGVVGMSGQFPNWQIAAYAITVALLVVLLEYPRPKRSNGTTVERRFQHYLNPVICKMKPMSSNYYSRFCSSLHTQYPLLFHPAHCRWCDVSHYCWLHLPCGRRKGRRMETSRTYKRCCYSN